MNVYGVIVIASFAIYSVYAQTNETFPGTCPAVNNQADFNETRFAGRWYEIKKFNNTLITGHCGLPQYTLISTGGFDVSYVATNLTIHTNATTTLILTKPFTGTAGSYDVTANGTKQAIGQRVLDTDYVTYSIVWGCTYSAATGNNTQRLSIYGRNNTLNATTVTKVLQFLTTAKINATTLVDVEQDHKKCGRSSATVLVVPAILSGIIAMFLTRKF